jgi:hypothetical protein
VTPFEEVVGVTLMQRSGDEEDDVVDHVGVPVAGKQHVRQSLYLCARRRERKERLASSRHVLHEPPQVPRRITPNVVELVNQPCCRLFSDRRRRDGRRLVRKEVSVIRCRELHPEI